MTEMDETVRHGESKPRRKRTGRKRTVFQAPARPAPAVRELWTQASQAEQRRAHETCMLMLEYWLGKKSKQEVASELGVPLLRVWQLSQQAVSGMLAGLLKQPRRRRTPAEIASTAPEDDPVRLRGQIRELETKLSRTEDLVRVLRTAPWAVKESPTEEDGRGRAKKRRKRASTSHRTRRVPSPKTRTHRSAAPQPAARPGGDGHAGGLGGSD